MSGAYCRYCGQRCFVLRILPAGSTWHLATCGEGRAHDRCVLGYDCDTARNPQQPARTPPDKALPGTG